MRRARTPIIITAVALALGAPGAALAQDLRTPDARDAATRPSETSVDLRTPDARDAATRPAETSVDLRTPDARDAATRSTVTSVDLRTPDARDAATRSTVTSVDLRTPDARDAATSATSSQPAVLAAEPAQGLAWDAVGIGAAAMLGLMFAAGGVGLLAFHARRRDGAAIEH